MGNGLLTYPEQINGMDGFADTVQANCSGGWTESFVPSLRAEDPDQECGPLGSIWAKRVADPFAYHGFGKAHVMLGINDARTFDVSVPDYIARLAQIAEQFCPGGSEPCLWVSTPNNIDDTAGVRARIDDYAAAIKADLWAACPQCCFGVDLNADVDCQSDPSECLDSFHINQAKQDELSTSIPAAMLAGCDRNP